MPYPCGRRRFRPRWISFLTTLAIFLILSFLIRSDPIATAIAGRKDPSPRLLCVFLQTHPTHVRFIHLNNITWAKHCHTISIVKYQNRHNPDDDSYVPQSSYHLNLWKRILAAIRQSIHRFEYISKDDSLIITPAPTFVFPEKLPSFLKHSNNHSQSPLIIIHEQQDTNIYILNGLALDLVRNSPLIDSCLQQSYPSARERHLWTCVKETLQREQTETICSQKNCFVQSYHYPLTLAHIKNGYCLQDHRSLCRSIVVLYPVTINDLVTLEFFKYRLKSKLSGD